MKVIALSGIVADFTAFANAILSLKGVEHGKLFLTLPSSVITG